MYSFLSARYLVLTSFRTWGVGLTAEIQEATEAWARCESLTLR